MTYAYQNKQQLEAETKNSRRIAREESVEAI